MELIPAQSQDMRAAMTSSNHRSRPSNRDTTVWQLHGSTMSTGSLPRPSLVSRYRRPTYVGSETWYGNVGGCSQLKSSARYAQDTDTCGKSSHAAAAGSQAYPSCDQANGMLNHNGVDKNSAILGADAGIARMEASLDVVSGATEPMVAIARTAKTGQPAQEGSGTSAVQRSLDSIDKILKTGNTIQDSHGECQRGTKSIVPEAGPHTDMRGADKNSSIPENEGMHTESGGNESGVHGSSVSEQGNVEQPGQCWICETGVQNPIGELDACGHQFCLQCITTWRKTVDKCPRCRVRFKAISTVKAPPVAADSVTLEPEAEIDIEVEQDLETNQTTAASNAGSAAAAETGTHNDVDKGNGESGDSDQTTPEKTVNDDTPANMDVETEDVDEEIDQHRDTERTTPDNAVESSAAADMDVDEKVHQHRVHQHPATSKKVQSDEVPCHPACMLRVDPESDHRACAFSVECDDCDEWFHVGCVGYQDPDSLPDVWFCNACKGHKDKPYHLYDFDQLAAVADDRRDRNGPEISTGSSTAADDGVNPLDATAPPTEPSPRLNGRAARNARVRETSTCARRGRGRTRPLTLAGKRQVVREPRAADCRREGDDSRIGRGGRRGRGRGRGRGSRGGRGRFGGKGTINSVAGGAADDETDCRAGESTAGSGTGESAVNDSGNGISDQGASVNGGEDAGVSCEATDCHKQPESDNADPESDSSQLPNLIPLHRQKYRDLASHNTVCTRCDITVGMSSVNAVAVCRQCPRIYCGSCLRIFYGVVRRADGSANERHREEESQSADGEENSTARTSGGDAFDEDDNELSEVIETRMCPWCLKGSDALFEAGPADVDPAQHLISKLFDHDLSRLFREPVDTMVYRDYVPIVGRDRMVDLTTIRSRFRNGRYQTGRGKALLKDDLQQMWKNCRLYARCDDHGHPRDESSTAIPGIVRCAMILKALTDRFCQDNIAIMLPSDDSTLTDGEVGDQYDVAGRSFAVADSSAPELHASRQSLGHNEEGRQQEPALAHVKNSGLQQNDGERRRGHVLLDTHRQDRDEDEQQTQPGSEASATTDQHVGSRSYSSFDTFRQQHKSNTQQRQQEERRHDQQSQIFSGSTSSSSHLLPEQGEAVDASTGGAPSSCHDDHGSGHGESTASGDGHDGVGQEQPTTSTDDEDNICNPGVTPNAPPSPSSETTISLLSTDDRVCWETRNDAMEVQPLLATEGPQEEEAQREESGASGTHEQVVTDSPTIESTSSFQPPNLVPVQENKYTNLAGHNTVCTRCQVAPLEMSANSIGVCHQCPRIYCGSCLRIFYGFIRSFGAEGVRDRGKSAGEKESQPWGVDESADPHAASAGASVNGENDRAVSRFAETRMCPWCLHNSDAPFEAAPAGVDPMLHLVTKLFDHDLSRLFRDSVDTTLYRDYVTIVSRSRMVDLTTVKCRLTSGRYRTSRGKSLLKDDLEQIWKNCRLYARCDDQGYPRDRSFTATPGIVRCAMILERLTNGFWRENMTKMLLVHEASMEDVDEGGDQHAVAGRSPGVDGNPDSSRQRNLRRNLGQREEGQDQPEAELFVEAIQQQSSTEHGQGQLRSMYQEDKEQQQDFETICQQQAPTRAVSIAFGATNFRASGDNQQSYTKDPSRGGQPTTNNNFGAQQRNSENISSHPETDLGGRRSPSSESTISLLSTDDHPEWETSDANKLAAALTERDESSAIEPRQWQQQQQQQDDGDNDGSPSALTCGGQRRCSMSQLNVSLPPTYDPRDWESSEDNATITPYHGRDNIFEGASQQMQQSPSGWNTSDICEHQQDVDGQHGRSFSYAWHPTAAVKHASGHIGKSRASGAASSSSSEVSTSTGNLQSKRAGMKMERSPVKKQALI